MSQTRHSKRFSKDGFHPLMAVTSDESVPPPPPANPNDATIDIPLQHISTTRSTGARKAETNEKETLVLRKPSRFHRAGVRRRLEAEGAPKKVEEDGAVNFMGRIYDKIYHFSVVTRYFLYVAPIALMIAVPIIVGAAISTGRQARIGGTPIVWFFTWIEIVWCSIWISKLIARFLPYLFQFVVGVISSGTRKYALILAALEIPLSLVGWTITSVATFRPVMTRLPGRENTSTNTQWIDIVERILFACLFSSLILLAEKLLIQLISISYHRKQFDDKIKDSKRNIALLTRLYDASKAMFPMYCPEFAEEDIIIGDILGLNALTSPGHHRSGSATPMKMIQGVQQAGEKVVSVFGNLAAEITGKNIFNPTAAHSEVVRALEKKRSAEALARRIWLSFVLEGHESLHLDDIVEVFGKEHEADAEDILYCLDIDGNGDVSLEEMILRVSEFGRERSALANSMRDVDSAIGVLDNLLMTVVLVAAIFIFVAWLNQSFVTTLATAGTALLSLSFVFSVTAQELLGSCIFLFVKHPFDVGDRVDILTEQLVVERISLLYTMFRKVKDHKRTQVPNIVLNGLWVDNVSRSKAMREAISLYVSFDTSFADIELLRKEMQDFVLAKDNARDFQPDLEVEVIDMAEMNKLQLKIEIRHKSNWAIESVRATRRSKFMCALVLALKKVPIYAPGGGSPVAGDKANPTYSVAISHNEAQENRQVYDDDKEKKRLVPTQAPSTTDSSPTVTSSNDFLSSTPAEVAERSAASQLNQRKPSALAVNPEIAGRSNSMASISDGESLDRQRSNDLQEVKSIMRRESTKGRRKGNNLQLAPTLETINSYGSAIPTLGTLGNNTQANKSPMRVADYYEDAGSSRRERPSVHVTSPSANDLHDQFISSQPQVTFQSSDAPLIIQTETSPAGRPRNDSVTQTPVGYESTNSNASNAYAQRTRPQSPPRQPVPGIHDMKTYLNQHPPGSGTQR